MKKKFQPIIDLFRTPTAAEIVPREIQETERLLLSQRDAAEYSGAMVGYLEQKLARLKATPPADANVSPLRKAA